MAEPLKAFFSRDLVRLLADDLGAAQPGFDTRGFVAQASKGLDGLELIDRGRHIARTLTNHLPDAYPDALEVVLRSVRAGKADGALAGVSMAPFFYLPHTIFVAERGLEHFDPSMKAQKELTKRFTAEFSIRPYLTKDPERVLRYLERWASDRDERVRRLVSEGTRLRLPWGARVAWLDAHPARVVALLERLKDDPASYVRRSVANNLNDLNKLHPKLLYDTCAGWLDDATPERRALVEHALRSAVKRGEPRALQLLGFGKKASVSIERTTFDPARVKIGDSVRVGFVLRSTTSKSQDLLVDLAVHFVKARGQTSKKVFKGKRVTLPARGELTLSRLISLAVHTTRVPHPGPHAVDVLVNGETYPAGAFDVTSAT